MTVFAARGALDWNRMPRFSPAGAVLALRRSPSLNDAAALRDVLERRPDLTLRLHGIAVPDLSNLAALPIRNLEVAGCEVLDGAQLGQIQSLEWLALRAVKSAMAVHDIGALANLRELHLSGHFAGIESLRRCRALRVLSLHGTREVESYDGFGLEALELRGISLKGPELLLPASLSKLTLSALNTLARLPDLAGMTALEWLRIESLPLVSDLRPLGTAPALRRLEILCMPHLSVHEVFPIAHLPGLRRLAVSLGGRRKDREVHRAFERVRAEARVDEGGSPSQRE